MAFGAKQPGGKALSTLATMLFVTAGATAVSHLCKIIREVPHRPGAPITTYFKGLNKKGSLARKEKDALEQILPPVAAGLAASLVGKYISH